MNGQRVSGAMEGTLPTARLSAIFIYPIKSCRGIAVSRANITPVGFRWDRNWLIVNAKGRAYTQRVESKLALVEIVLPTDAFSDNWHPTEQSIMKIKAPGMRQLAIPLTAPSNIVHGVSVWEWTGSALDEGEEAADWFSDYLGKPSRLVRFNAASDVRAVENAPEYNVFFADKYPYLLISQGSLNALNQHLKDPIPINRFRPNILVDGCEPFAEDLWKEIQIGEYSFKGMKLCSRCKVPTINQETGVSGAEPTEALKIFRSDQVLRPTKKQQGKVYFGQNLVWSNLTPGNEITLQIGDLVYVLNQVQSAAEAEG